MEPSKDDRLWRMARKRANFKKNLFSFLIIISFFWAIWWFTGGRNVGSNHYPWPVWVMLGWGVALGFQYFSAYGGDRNDLTIEEYKKLKEKEDIDS